jgi:molybdate transport system ATP-binding protein
MEVTAQTSVPDQTLTGTASLDVRIRKRFSNVEGSFDLDLQFHVDPGFTILFGASGAGKTTVLDSIAGLTRPAAGRIAIAGSVVFDRDKKQDVPPWKRNIGYVLQDLALFPHLTAEENVAFGLHELAAAERQRRSREILRTFRIEHLGGRRPAQISGGERQRVALARTLVTEPHALLLDEPLAALDRPTKAHILDDLRRWNETHCVPILYVTHSHEEVFALGEQVIVLAAGRVVARGLPHAVMSAPRLEAVAQLLGFENIFDASVISLNEERGTMSCRLQAGTVELETPLVRAEAGSTLRIGIRAGDLLLATEPPRGLSARNVIAGTIRIIERRDVIISTVVNCSGAEFEVHLTLAARESLQLAPGKEVWLVVKTYSCHLMSKP